MLKELVRGGLFVSQIDFAGYGLQEAALQGRSEVLRVVAGEASVVFEDHLVLLGADFDVRVFPILLAGRLTVAVCVLAAELMYKLGLAMGLVGTGIVIFGYIDLFTMFESVLNGRSSETA